MRYLALMLLAPWLILSALHLPLMPWTSLPPSWRRETLVAAAAVPEPGTFRVLTSALGVPLTLLVVLAILLVAGIAAMRLRVRMRLVRR